MVINLRTYNRHTSVSEITRHRQSNLDRNAFEVTSSCIYQFECPCGSKYLGRTERRLATRIAEHMPKSSLNMSKLPASSIARHLLDCTQCYNPKEAFTVIIKQPNSLLIRFSEACAIRRLKPNLCKQPDFVTSLSLPW